MGELIAILIGGFLYSAAIGGYALLFYEEIACISRKLVIRGRFSAARKRYREESPLNKHLNRVLQATFNKSFRAVHFLWFCGLLFFGVCIVAMRSMAAPGAFATALAAALLPYFILRVKLEIIRQKSSFEGEAFISNFLGDYKISNCNIFEAIEKAGKRRQKTKICAELMAGILLEIRNTANHKEIGRAVDKFAYAINTNWGRMFGYNLKIAMAYGSDISLALEDILIQLREAKAACEERKKINAEAARIVKFLIPALYLTSVYMSVTHVGIPIQRFLYNQVFTAEGFMMLAAAAFLFIMNLVLLELVNNQQFDY